MSGSCYLGNELTRNFFDIVSVDCCNNGAQDALGQGWDSCQRGDGFDFQFVEFFDSFQHFGNITQILNGDF
jgi:hypothetical protein